MVEEVVNTGGMKSFVYSSKGGKKREVKTKEQTFSFVINLKTLFFQPLKGIDIEMRKIDFDFFDTIVSKKGRRSKLKSKTFKSKTSNGGMANFEKIDEGVYVARFIKKSSSFEKIIEVKENLTKKVYAPLFFILFKINKKVDNKEVIEILEKNRSDYNYCAFCDGKYQTFSLQPFLWAIHFYPVLEGI